MQKSVMESFLKIYAKVKSKGAYLHLFGDNAISFYHGLPGHITTVDTAKELVTSLRPRNKGYSDDQTWELAQCQFDEIQYLNISMNTGDVKALISEGALNGVFSADQQKAIMKMIGALGDDTTPIGYQVDQYGNLVNDPTNDGAGNAQGLSEYNPNNSYGVHVG